MGKLRAIPVIDGWQLRLGNGWDNPVPGMTDSSNLEHNKRNRRVEVKVFALEKE